MGAVMSYEHKHVGQWRIPSAVAVLLVVLFVAVSSWGIWRWMQKSSVMADAIAVDAPAGGRRANLVDQPPGRIFKRDGTIRAHSDKYSLTITLPNREMSLRCTSGDEWLNRDQELLLKMSQRWLRGNNSLRGLKFTDEQKAQMKLVAAEPTLPLQQEDKARLDALVKAWEDASDAGKANAQRALLIALREIGQRNLSVGKEAFVASVNKLGAIITPQQLDQYRQLDSVRRGGNRPALPPTTRGA